MAFDKKEKGAALTGRHVPPSLTPAIMSTSTSVTSNPRTKEIIDPSYPLLHANAKSIESIKRETFQYGPMEAHELDVYYPPSLDVSQYTGQHSNTCILVFFHGGGLTHGARSSPPSYLVHNNLGAFFASRGILTVIPDYRLVPSITFPQGSEDIRDALDWVVKNLPSKDESQRSRSRLFVLAHSAGGVHLSGFLFTPSIFSASLSRHSLSGIAFLGVPYETHRAKPAFRNAVIQYYGNAKNVSRNQPLSLLRSAEASHIAGLPPIRNVLAASEPRSISSSAEPFVQAFREKGGNISEHKLPGHDHISPILALSSGSGEAWAEELVAWMTSMVGS